MLLRLPLPDILTAAMLTAVAHLTVLRFTLHGVPRDQARDAVGRAFEHWFDYLDERG
jgi:hypothetical protein